MRSWKIKSESVRILPAAEYPERYWAGKTNTLYRWLDLTDKENPEFVYSL